jgi:hypothetical protein
LYSKSLLPIATGATTIPREAIQLGPASRFSVEFDYGLAVREL